MINLLHCFLAFRQLGGVQSILHHHHKLDRSAGLNSRFVVYLEPPEPSESRVHFLGLSQKSNTAQTRAAFRRAVADFSNGPVIYHIPWGIPFLVDLDNASRRILMLHGEAPGLREEIARRGRWLDGVLCVSEPIRRLVQESIPQLDPERITVVPYPVTPPADPHPKPGALADREIVIGVVGRLSFEQKRVDRIPVFCQSLQKRGIRFQMEFLGDGPERPWLERALPNRQQFVFHLRQTGDRYWDVLRRWDFVLFVTDYEGTPISLLEAMSMGVLPIYPNIGSGGDAYTSAVHNQLLYPAYDFDLLAGTLHQLLQADASAIAELRARSQEAVRPHLGMSYMNSVTSFLAQIQSLPKISSDHPERRAFPLEHLSFDGLAKLVRARDRLMRFTSRRNLIKPAGSRPS